MYVICVGVSPVVLTALKFNVPRVVVCWMALVGSDPMETDAAIMSDPETGPSTVIGNAAMLGTKGLALSRVTFVGSYFTWNLTKVTRLLPGFTVILRGIESPTFF